MMASQHDRLAEHPPLQSTVSEGWVLLILTAGCAAVVAWVAVA